MPAFPIIDTHRALAGLGEADLRRIDRDNANPFYRLGL